MTGRGRDARKQGKNGDANGERKQAGTASLACEPGNQPAVPARDRKDYTRLGGRACMLHLDGVSDVSCQLSTQAQIMADRLSLCLERRILTTYSGLAGAHAVAVCISALMSEAYLWLVHRPAGLCCLRDLVVDDMSSQTRMRSHGGAGGFLGKHWGGVK